MFSTSFRTRTRTRTRSLTLTRQQSIDRRPRSRAARATQAQKAQLHNCQAVETLAIARPPSGDGGYVLSLATVATPLGIDALIQGLLDYRGDVENLNCSLKKRIFRRAISDTIDTKSDRRFRVLPLAW